MIRVFCDFDGTVCSHDIGDQFFMKFAGEKAGQNIQRLLGGEITMQEWLTELCEAIPSIHQKEYESFLLIFVPFDRVLRCGTLFRNPCLVPLFFFFCLLLLVILFLSCYFFFISAISEMV